MPTTILDGESYEQALHRRYAEEAAFDARSMNHTKEPWSFSPAENGLEWGVEAGKWGVAICADAPGDGTSEANARRIVACVNACAGLPTDTLETIPSWSSAGVKTLADVVKQRDELLAALELLKEAVEHTRLAIRGIKAVEHANTAIASAKGGAA